MSLKKYSHEEIEKMSMLELANLILLDGKKAQNFRDVFEKIAKMKGFTNEENKERIAQFYTDLNLDGRFMTIGSNMWGLKRWYPVEQADEEVTNAPKKKKKKAKAKPKKKKKEKEPEVEEDLDVVDDNIEVLTANFNDDDDDDDEDEDIDFDDEFDDDDYDESDDDDDESDEEEVKK
ncbi:DNA-directed RNA polymerase subunit delta [Virgibacillus byunsanensis]|uniref:Probable DNA-directed RNA polymerase subunit delta n=1 Tax=Virgibacillus byunsanensis TaxID=570945 RepID=A0ABW3LGE8_9BACI